MASRLVPLGAEKYAFCLIPAVVYWIIIVKMFSRLFIILSATLFVALGCRKDEQPRSYTVPKENLPEPVVQTQMAQAPPMAATTPDIPVNKAPIQWTLPDGWQQLPSDGVRIGNFLAPGKDGATAAVAITSFPGEVGTELGNVNRWRQQVGLSEVDQSGVSSEPVTVDSSEGKLFDLAGSAGRTVVALVRRNGATWFFKITGDSGAVGDAKPAFMAFLKSVHFSGASELAGASTAPVTPVAAPTAAPAADNSSPKWNVPSDWVEKTPGPMLFKSFAIGDSTGTDAAVTVSFFPGDVGGKLANVNRWRGQMGLSEVAEDQLPGVTEQLITDAGKATLVDFAGADASASRRLVAVIVPHGDDTWFYKLLGDMAVVAKEKDTFVNFVKTVQYP